MFLKQVCQITTCDNSFENKIYKGFPKYVHCHIYKNFNEQDFKLELRGKSEADFDTNYETFQCLP